MDYKAIHELIDIMNKSELYSLEIENSEIKIKMKKGPDYVQTEIQKDNNNLNETEKFSEINDKNIEIKEESNKENVASEENKNDSNVYCVKAPMVGTFYSSSNPDKEAFASVGASVKKGDVLCIIEAMKLMNEIECEYDGTVQEVLVKNGDMVEYGQDMMKIKKA